MTVGRFRAEGQLRQPSSEVGTMRSKPKLLAAITVSGAILSLGVSAEAHQARNQGELAIGSESESVPLSARVEQLRKKLQSSSPVFHDGSTEGRIDNIVQFFNFSNR